MRETRYAVLVERMGQSYGGARLGAGNARPVHALFSLQRGACAAGCSAQPSGTGYTACTVQAAPFAP